MSTIKNKTVLVTGGTGSFGLFIVNRLLRLGAKEVRVMSRDEKKHYDMRILYANEKRLTLITGDIRDRCRVLESMHGCEVVYQAAALKHVNNCEVHPFEAVQTNVLGAQNVVSAALELGVDKLICVSTDKAVKPVNVMGMSKAIQERLVIAANRSPANQGTKLSCVRYGNVMSSRGSAIPYFRSLVASGKEITITEPSMTRFLLTLDDAIDLVMFATDNMAGGEVFVKKAPSVTILSLARAISEEASVPFRYKVIGTIPGEKMHEILISEEELPRTANAEGYFVVHPWWQRKRIARFGSEYSSSGNVIERIAVIRKLLKRSDSEFQKYGFKDSVFSK